MPVTEIIVKSDIPRGGEIISPMALPERSPQDRRSLPPPGRDSVRRGSENVYLQALHRLLQDAHHPGETPGVGSGQHVVQDDQLPLAPRQDFCQCQPRSEVELLARATSPWTDIAACRSAKIAPRRALAAGPRRTCGVSPPPEGVRPSPQERAEKATRAATSLIIPAFIGPPHLEPCTASRHRLSVQHAEGGPCR